MKIDKKTLMKIIMEELEYNVDIDGLFNIFKKDQSGLKFTEEHQKEISIKMAQIALNKKIDSNQKMVEIESVIAEYSKLAEDVQKKFKEETSPEIVEAVQQFTKDVGAALGFLENKDKKFNGTFLNQYFTKKSPEKKLASTSFLIAAEKGTSITLSGFKDAYKKATGKDVGPNDEEGGDKPTSKFDHHKFTNLRTDMEMAAKKADKFGPDSNGKKYYSRILSGLDPQKYDVILNFIFNKENIKHFKQRPNVEGGNYTYIVTLLGTMRGVAETFFDTLKKYYLDALEFNNTPEKLKEINDSFKRRFETDPEEKRQDWEFDNLLELLKEKELITEKEYNDVKSFKTEKFNDLVKAIKEEGRKIDGGGEDSDGEEGDSDGEEGGSDEKPDGEEEGSDDSGGDSDEKPDGEDEGSDEDGEEEGKDGDKDIDIDEEVKKAAVENAETTIKIIKSLIKANNLLKAAGGRVPDGASEEEQARIEGFVKDTDARIERLEALLGELEELVDTDPVAELLPIIRDNIFEILEKSLNLVQGEEEVQKEKYKKTIDELMDGVFTEEAKVVLGVQGYLDKVFAEFYDKKVVKLKDVDNAKVIQFFDELKKELEAKGYEVKFDFIEKLRKKQKEEPLAQKQGKGKRVAILPPSGGSSPSNTDDEDLPFEESKIRLSRNKVSSIISEEIEKIFKDTIRFF